MATATGTTYRYADPVGAAVTPARLTEAGRAAVALRESLAALGIGASTTVTDIGDEVVARQRPAQRAGGTSGRAPAALTARHGTVAGITRPVPGGPMATATGTTYRYADPVGASVTPARLTESGRAAVALRESLAALGIGADTTVTDIGDEVVDRHAVKLIGWINGDGTPQVTSLCLRLFVENFRRVA